MSQVMFGFVLASDWLERQLLGPDWLEHFGDVFEVFSVENHAIVLIDTIDVQFIFVMRLICCCRAGVYSI